MESLDYKYIAKLVERAKIGDSDAFAELYAATYQREYFYAYHYLKDEYLAQDALQETYILALKNLAKLKDPSLVISWLNQINFRVCYNLNKKMQRHKEELQLSDEELILMENQHKNNHFHSPEESFIKIESKEYLINQILNLPFTESQVIILTYFQNMKLDEVARVMDISRSSVKRYLKAGRKRLASVLHND